MPGRLSLFSAALILSQVSLFFCLKLLMFKPMDTPDWVKSAVNIDVAKYA